MRISQLILVSLCVLVAFCIPTDLSRPVEIATMPAANIKAVASLQAPKFEEVQELASIGMETAPASAPKPVSQSHSELMDAAGIPKDQQAAAEQLIHRESSWNPTARNSIGACSLVQALPCNKIPGDWTNPINALTWGNQYVQSRYNNWPTALQHSLTHNWY